MTLKKLNESRYRIPTQLIYGKSYTPEWDYSHHVIPPISASSTFRLDTVQRGAKGFEEIGKLLPNDSVSAPVYVYDRMGEPNNALLQHSLAVAERGEIAVTFASGMAAVHAATLMRLREGSEIVSHKTIYGCSYSLFTRWLRNLGIKTHFVDLTNPDLLPSAVNAKTRVVYLESPVNPTLELLDLPAIANRVKQINAGRPPEERIVTVIDNTFATPYCQRPIEHGIDIVVHSLTKGISGFGTILGGAVITRGEFHEDLVHIRKDFGGILVPQTAWNVLLYGVSTLALRIPRQQRNAELIAQYLEQHPKVESVRYPGLSSFPQHQLARRMLKDYNGEFAPGFMIYFSVKGANPDDSKMKGARMMDFIAENAYTVTLAVSLGQIRTLIEHPGSMTHASYSAAEQIASGIEPGGIRLAVGIEEPSDIITDLDAALSAI